MADVFTRAKRSDVMSRIRSRGNKDTEVAFANLLRRNHITGWRRHLKLRIDQSAGVAVSVQSRAVLVKKKRSKVVRPDFVFPQAKVAVFVDGCFWHGCPIHSKVPATNRTFWKKKLVTNKSRDRLVNKQLGSAGWRIVRIWEHDLASAPGLAIQRVRNAVNKRN